MWMLVYVEAGLSSLGIIGILLAIILGCGLVYALGLMGIAWVTSPISTWLLLNRSPLPVWVLPALLAVGMLLNLFLRKCADGWHPMSLVSVCAVISAVLGIWYCIDQQLVWYHYLWVLPVFCIVGTLIIYPYLWLLVTVTALPLVTIDRKYAGAALFCLLGLLSGVLMLHSIVALIAGMLQTAMPLGIDMQYFNLTAQLSGMQPTDALFRQTTVVYTDILTSLRVIPLGWRFVLSAAGCIGCTIGEWKCSCSEV